MGVYYMSFSQLPVLTSICIFQVSTQMDFSEPKKKRGREPTQQTDNHKTRGEEDETSDFDRGSKQDSNNALFFSPEERRAEETSSHSHSTSASHVNEPPIIGPSIGRTSPIVLNKRWTKKEDQRLHHLSKTASSSLQARETWHQHILPHFPNRSYEDVHARYTKVILRGVVMGNFSTTEDDIIRNCVRGGMSDWNEVAAQVPGRSTKQCRERWETHIDPTLHFGNWTTSEDYLIIYGEMLYGKRWTQIASYLPRRSPNMVKNRRNSTHIRELKTDVDGFCDNLTYYKFDEMWRIVELDNERFTAQNRRRASRGRRHSSICDSDFDGSYHGFKSMSTSTLQSKSTHRDVDCPSSSKLQSDGEDGEKYTRRQPKRQCKDQVHSYVIPSQDEYGIGSENEYEYEEDDEGQDKTNDYKEEVESCNLSYEPTQVSPSSSKHNSLCESPLKKTRVGRPQKPFHRYNYNTTEVATTSSASHNQTKERLIVDEGRDQHSDSLMEDENQSVNPYLPGFDEVVNEYSHNGCMHSDLSTYDSYIVNDCVSDRESFGTLSSSYTTSPSVLSSLGTDCSGWDSPSNTSFDFLFEGLYDEEKEGNTQCPILKSYTSEEAQVPENEEDTTCLDEFVLYF